MFLKSDGRIKNAFLKSWLFVFMIHLNFGVKIRKLDCLHKIKYIKTSHFNKTPENHISTFHTKFSKMSQQIRKDIENRLETTYHIRANLEENSETERLCVIGKMKIPHKCLK
jgi:hypothetical protein